MTKYFNIYTLAKIRNILKLIRN